jgi:hypothetical protein
MRPGGKREASEAPSCFASELRVLEGKIIFVPVMMVESSRACDESRKKLPELRARCWPMELFINYFNNLDDFFGSRRNFLSGL